MFPAIAVIYLVFKGAFLAGLIKAFTSNDSLSRKPIMIAGIYTAGVAALSYVFLNPELLRTMNLGMQDRRLWLITTFLLASLYFWLLAKFEDAGALWWSILILGLGLLIY